MLKKEMEVPVTRIEGHGKIVVTLNENGSVADAKFIVTQLRGFEKFCEGRLMWEMPVITSRICGICPVSHHLASAKAVDAILGVEIPIPAKKLRLLLHMGQIIQSHALSLFYLSFPDLILGYDYDIEKRNIIGLLEKKPELAKKGIELRKFGQTIIEILAGRRVHPKYAIPGGVSKALKIEDREDLRKQIDEKINDIESCLEIVKSLCLNQEDIPISTYFMGLVNRNNELELYDGNIRVKNQKGEIVEEKLNPINYLSIIGERVEDWSYLKFPYYKKAGFPDGSLRVGPLARLNVADKISTPLAEEEFKEFQKLKENGVVNGVIYYHYARIIEMLYAAENVKNLLEDDDICSKDIWVNSIEIKNSEGIGVIEAPRGTLIHHYWVNENGVITKVNLIVSTVFNNMGMNLAIKEIAVKNIKNLKVNEGILNRMEAAIRCFDPCLSCSTHAIGQMPLTIQIVSVDGKIVKEITRS
ncbi:Ni/Fe hydrogenase subunit alpha [Candidatus Bathyarchaeota archaeon]|nr:Ni/Fe hydrogenase subunit alpha [Candidatus Bathyarchaeota archaeon]